MAASTASSSLNPKDPEGAAFLEHFTHPTVSLSTPPNADRLFAAQAQDVLERQIAFLPGECGVEPPAAVLGAGERGALIGAFGGL